MKKFYTSLKTVWDFFKTFIKWLLCAGTVGVVGGGAGALLSLGVEYMTKIREGAPWLLYFLPVGGLLTVGLYRLSHREGCAGTDLVIESVRSAERVPTRMGPLVLISTLITHLFGGSTGKIGAALQMGGSVGATVGRWLRLDEKDLRILTMCGMSAAFGALYQIPLTAAFFAMEVISVGVIYYTAFFPCAVASLTGRMVAGALGARPLFPGPVSIPPLSFSPFFKVTVLAALCAGVSILFCMALYKGRKWYGKFFPDPYVRIAAGGLLMILFTLLSGSGDYNGTSFAVIGRAVAGEARPEAFALKILATALTMGAGYKGGEVAPAFFVGATFGCFAGGLLGLNPGFGAAVGLICVFCGAVNCPMASVVLSVELFGGGGLLFFGLACAVSFMLSGYYGLYGSQKIVYSKLRPDFIDRKIEINQK